ncbi:MAG: hypothetical protein ACK5LY_07285, partial [Lachnospirales bacterium]
MKKLSKMVMVTLALTMVMSVQAFAGTKINVITNGVTTYESYSSGNDRITLTEEEGQAIADLREQKREEARIKAIEYKANADAYKESIKDTPLDENLSKKQQEVLELVNQERAAEGLAPLELDTELSMIATAKCKDMNLSLATMH